MLISANWIQLKIASSFLSPLMPLLRWFESDKPNAPFVADKLTHIEQLLQVTPSQEAMRNSIQPAELTPELYELMRGIHERLYAKWTKHFELITNQNDPANVELVKFWHVARSLNPARRNSLLLSNEETVSVLMAFAPESNLETFQYDLFFCYPLFI